MLDYRRSIPRTAAAAGMAFAILGVTAYAFAHQAPSALVTIPIFRGDIGGASNIALGSWGSGSAESSKESVLIGNNSIKVTTAGYYQGARLDFAAPIDLAAAFATPRTYLRFQVKFTGKNSTQNAFNQENLQTTKQASSPFAKMRYLLVMADGSRYELVRPVDVPPSEDPDAYTPLAFPLSAVLKQLPAGKTLTGDGAKLKQLAIFGDRYADFLIGEIGVITDETEITVAPLDAPPAFARSETTFVANAEGGASTLHYSWDFDADDGIQEDASGRVVTHVFPNTGKGNKTYKITLTVSDVDGLKKPAVEKLELDVSD
jgi:hypothetical protein